MRTEEIASRLATIKKRLQALDLHTLTLRVEEVENLIEEYTSQLWTSPCICPPDEKTGETLCCNICGKPTARTSVYDDASLHPREWWQDLKEGDKFVHCSQAIIHSGNIYLGVLNSAPALLNNCTPYAPPSAQDIIAKHNLSEEEVKILREGKCT
jgi:hypothetical protein